MISIKGFEYLVQLKCVSGVHSNGKHRVQKSTNFIETSCLCVGIPGLGEHIVEDMYHLVWKGNTNN